MQVLSRRVDSRVSVPRFRSLIAFSNRLVRIVEFKINLAERIQRIRAFPFINCNGALIPCDDFGDVFFLCRCLDDEVRRVHTSRRYRNLFVEQLEELRSIRDCIIVAFTGILRKRFQIMFGHVFASDFFYTSMLTSFRRAARGARHNRVSVGNNHRRV